MQLLGRTNRGSAAGAADIESDPELPIPQLRNLWFGSFLLSLFCFKLKYPLTAVEGFPDSPNSFQGKRLKTRMVLFILQHRSLWLHAPSPSPNIPPHCCITDPRPHRLRSARGDRPASLHGGATR